MTRNQWIVIGVLGFCIMAILMCVCGAIGILMLNSSAQRPVAVDEPVRVSKQTQAAPTLPRATAMPIVTDTPQSVITLMPVPTKPNPLTPVPTERPTNPPPAPGSSRSNPVPIGTAVTWVDGPAQISQKVLQVIRGDAAWQKIKSANMFNPPAQAGTEYVLISLQGDYLQGDANKAYSLNSGNCVIVSSDGRIFQSYKNFASPPDPKYSSEAFPGAKLTGWVVHTTPTGDANPLLQCGRKYDGSGGVWLSLK